MPLPPNIRTEVISGQTILINTKTGRRYADEEAMEADRERIRSKVEPDPLEAAFIAHRKATGQGSASVPKAKAQGDAV